MPIGYLSIWEGEEGSWGNKWIFFKVQLYMIGSESRAYNVQVVNWKS